MIPIVRANLLAIMFPQSEHDTRKIQIFDYKNGDEGNQAAKRGTAYQISQGIQLLSHQTALLPPPRNLPVHKVEE